MILLLIFDRVETKSGAARLVTQPGPPASVYLQIPNTGGVEEGRGHLLDPVRLSNVPHIQAVVAVHGAEPAADGVILKGDDVCKASIRSGVGKMAVGEKIRREMRKTDRKTTSIKESFRARIDAARHRMFYNGSWISARERLGPTS